jgi:predicted transposase/invertase (TIGR01784 family)
MNIYDSGYKSLFSHPEIVQALLINFLKESWIKDVDFNSLEKVNSSYVSEKYKRRESDLVWRIKFKKQWMYLYLLLEFQSTVDHFMGIRLMSYVGLLYQDLIRSQKLTAKDHLPPVLPWIVYNGEKQWKAPIQSLELLDPKAPQALKRYFPSFQYQLLDLGRYPLAAVQQDSSNLVLPLIEFEQNVHNREDAIPIIERLIEQLRSPKFDSLRRAFAIYANRVLELKGIGPTQKDVLELLNCADVKALEAAAKHILTVQSLEEFINLFKNKKTVKQKKSDHLKKINPS